MENCVYKSNWRNVFTEQCEMSTQRLTTQMAYALSRIEVD